MGILCWSLVRETPRWRPLLLLFWLLLPLLSLRPSPRLMLIPTFSMVDMVGMDLDTLDTLVTMDWDIATMESVKLSPRLMLMLICTEDTMDMVLDTVDIMDSVMLSPRLMHTCMEDMLDSLDMPDTMDTPMVDMPTMDKLLPLISKWTARHPCFLYQ